MLKKMSLLPPRGKSAAQLTCDVHRLGIKARQRLHSTWQRTYLLVSAPTEFQIQTQFLRLLWPTRRTVSLFVEEARCLPSNSPGIWRQFRSEGRWGLEDGYLETAAKLGKSNSPEWGITNGKLHMAVSSAKRLWFGKPMTEKWYQT